MTSFLDPANLFFLFGTLVGALTIAFSSLIGIPLCAAMAQRLVAA